MARDDVDICKACDDLKYNAPHFTANGLTDQECQSLMNNTGLDPKANHDDCEDLHNMNDCLIAGIQEDIEAYDDCDWKAWANDMMTNLYNMLKGMICAICGIWDEIARIWNLLNRLKCLLDQTNEGVSIIIPEEYATPGPDVSWKRIDGNWDPPTITGNNHCVRYFGSIHLGQSWLNGLPYNYNGEPDYISNGGRLLWRWRIRKSDFGIRNMWGVNCQTTNVGTETMGETTVYWAGQQTKGYMSATDPNGVETVPEGWIYVDMRLHHAKHLGDGDITMSGVAPILMDVERKC